MQNRIKKPIVLITGTTSGIGLALRDAYLNQGWTVICVNREGSKLNHAINDEIHSFETNISCIQSVTKLLNKLISINLCPSLFILNAGINKPDNLRTNFDFAAYLENMNTNLHGVLSFVASARNMQLESRTFIGISSVSNLVPNPGHLGYHLAKVAIDRAFKVLRRSDKTNNYKTVILGPVNTPITRYYQPPTGIGGIILKQITITTAYTAQEIISFAKSRKAVIWLPLRARIFYNFLRLVLAVVPGIYQGTQSKDDSKLNAEKSTR